MFVSVGGLLNVGRVHWDTPSLKTLSSLIVFKAIDEQLDLVDELPLPLNDKAIIKSHGSHVVEVNNENFYDQSGLLNYCYCVLLSAAFRMLESCAKLCAVHRLVVTIAPYVPLPDKLHIHGNCAVNMPAG